LASQIAASSDLLNELTLWGDQKREAFLPESPAEPVPERDEKVSQSVVFHDDFKRLIHTFSLGTQYEAASLAQSIATLVASPFALFAELYRLCNRSIDASTCLHNICVIPKHIVLSILKTAFYALRSANNTATAASTGLGFLAWHGGEALVRWIKGSSDTVLSNQARIRDIVYDAIGITLISAATVFIPVAPIQMFALPIILGSIYGTINNQFTVRECPEYYTMGHYYDGTDLKGHAIKTNNLLIKPIVTGCYATTMVTRIAGAILAAAGTLSYTDAILPVPYAAAMIAGVCVISLIAGHIFSCVKKRAIQKNLDEVAALIGLKWTETNLNKTWKELSPILVELAEQKRRELESNPQERERMVQKLRELAESLDADLLSEDLPVKYMTGWQANNTRNSIGYLGAGLGTLAIAVSTVFLRIFAL
jgi:hypothetical protein